MTSDWSESPPYVFRSHSCVECRSFVFLPASGTEYACLVGGRQWLSVDLVERGRRSFLCTPRPPRNCATMQRDEGLPTVSSRVRTTSRQHLHLMFNITAPTTTRDGATPGKGASSTLQTFCLHTKSRRDQSNLDLPHVLYPNSLLFSLRSSLFSSFSRSGRWGPPVPKIRKAFAGRKGRHHFGGERRLRKPVLFTIKRPPSSPTLTWQLYNLPQHRRVGVGLGLATLVSPRMLVSYKRHARELP